MQQSISLVEKYRPRTLADVRGQDWIIQSLRAFVASPSSTAFLFSGGTGAGKTSTALALCADLGIDVERGEFGGLYQIPSGEQSGETVRKLVRSLYSCPFFGSGWNALIVNEADHMTANAAQVWLDVLEHLPPQTIVIFTTNDASRLARRFRTRCEHFAFESSALLLGHIAQQMIADVWLAETGRKDAPKLDTLADVIDENGELSFRQVLQSLAPLVRTGSASVPAPVPVPVAAIPAAPDIEDLEVLKSLADRWHSGEKLSALAPIVGLTWQKLIGAFWAHGIVDRGCKTARA